MATAVAGVVAISSLAVGVLVLRHAGSGRARMTEARAAALAQDAAGARAAFGQASASFEAAGRDLAAPWAVPLRLAPWLRRQHAAAQALARAGVLGAKAGVTATGAIDAAPPGGWGLRQGAVDLTATRRAVPALRQAAMEAGQALEIIQASPGTALVGPLAEARAEAIEQGRGAADGLRKAATAAEALPSLLGERGTKRYVVAFANLAELRGTGGFIGYISFVSAQNGRVRLEPDSGRPTDRFPPLAESAIAFPQEYANAYREYGVTTTWQNVNMGLHFPTAASAIMQGVRGTAGAVDGVIQIDPLGIAAMLKLTGPISVASWPVPISESNVSQVMHHDQYVRYQGQREKRTQLLKELVNTTFAKFLSSDLGLQQGTTAELGKATAAGHIIVYSKHTSDESALNELEVTGHLSRVQDATDVLEVVSENAAANKVDYFLRRDIRYDVTLHPDDGSAEGALTVVMRNTAALGDSADVVRSVEGDAPDALSRQIILVARPLSDDLNEMTIGGRDWAPQRTTEQSLSVYQAFASVPPGGETELRAAFEVPDAFVTSKGEQVYRLRILPQPIASPDYLEVSVRAPKGWTIAGPTRFEGDLSRDVVLEIRAKRTLRSRIVDALFLRPYRVFRDWLL